MFHQHLLHGLAVYSILKNSTIKVAIFKTITSTEVKNNHKFVQNNVKRNHGMF